MTNPNLPVQAYWQALSACRASQTSVRAHTHQAINWSEAFRRMGSNGPGGIAGQGLESVAGTGGALRRTYTAASMTAATASAAAATRHAPIARHLARLRRQWDPAKTSLEASSSPASAATVRGYTVGKEKPMVARSLHRTSCHFEVLHRHWSQRANVVGSYMRGRTIGMAN
jgi:hypothetical protein